MWSRKRFPMGPWTIHHKLSKTNFQSVASIHVSVYSSNGKLKTERMAQKQELISNIFSKGLRKHFSSAIVIEESILQPSKACSELLSHDRDRYFCSSLCDYGFCSLLVFFCRLKRVSWCQQCNLNQWSDHSLTSCHMTL